MTVSRTIARNTHYDNAYLYVRDCTDYERGDVLERTRGVTREVRGGSGAPLGGVNILGLWRIGPAMGHSGPLFSGPGHYCR